MQTAILLIQCPDKPGIVATISSWIFQQQANIIRSDQYSTNPSSNQFFMRLEFCFDDKKLTKAQLEQGFSSIAAQICAQWKIFYKNEKLRMGILVSQHDHCLYDLLYHWKSAEINVDIPFILSNHHHCETLAKQHKIDFHYLPLTTKNKLEQEQRVLELVKDQTDFLALARYMQILSLQFLNRYNKDIINIHHSFLPSFVGANPYQQAYDRGVKIIGATAHYITEVLDEGPIIGQMVEQVAHYDSVNDLKRKGKHIEKLTFINAIAAHTEHRVIRFGNKTIVFN